MTRKDPRLILASASPRRKDLLAQIGLAPDRIEPADIDESVEPREVPSAYARRVAHAKGAIIAARHPHDIVLSADTAVACGRRILPKTDDEHAARACLGLLSGRAHRVYTAIAVFGPGAIVRERLVETRVKVKRLTDGEIEAYLASGEWRGKAGGYGVQGLFGAHIIQLIGSYTGVVGLPLYETRQLLVGAGLAVAGTVKTDASQTDASETDAGQTDVGATDVG